MQESSDLRLDAPTGSAMLGFGSLSCLGSMTWLAVPGDTNQVLAF